MSVNPEKETLETEENNQVEESVEGELVDEIETETSDSTETPESQQESQQELEEAQAKIKDYWDQIVRLNAEMDNHRKRSERDLENAHKYAVKNFAEALLPVTDSMEMGINASQAENATLESIKEGMDMTLSMFSQMLEKNGIEAINPVGEKFDPERHQAMSMQESADHEPNTVMVVMQKGYMLNGRLIRPAMVMVSK